MKQTGNPHRVTTYTRASIHGETVCTLRRYTTVSATYHADGSLHRVGGTALDWRFVVEDWS